MREMEKNDLLGKVCNLCSIAPREEVGVMGDERTYENVIALEW